MISHDQPLRKETISRMINAVESSIYNDNHDYTTWELEFIQWVASYFEIKQDLSDRQCEILERMYDKL